MKILTLNGGGDSVDATVGFAANPLAETIRSGIAVNTGDLLVHHAILKIISYSSIKNIQFSEFSLLEGVLKEFEPDICVLRGSNYFTQSHDWMDVARSLEQIQVPIVAIGIGVQMPSFKKMKLPDGSVRLLKVLSERGVSIGARGQFSADVFVDHGISNVDVIGCPSVYLSLKRQLSFKPIAPNPVVGLNLNRYVNAEYSFSKSLTLRHQQSLLKNFLSHHRGYIYTQGEAEETRFALLGDSSSVLTDALFSYGISDPVMSKSLESRLLAFSNVQSWLDHLRANSDVVIGYRLHGVLASIAQELPGFLFTYDSRLQEIAELFSFPHVRLQELPTVQIERIIASIDMRPFEDRYVEMVDAFADFLTANGLSHNLETALQPAVANSASQYKFPPGHLLDRTELLQELEWQASRADNLDDRLYAVERSLSRCESMPM